MTQAAIQSSVRKPAVAGKFYPADPEELRAVVRRLLDEAGDNLQDQPLIKALISPHAGYIYSGPIAASAYAPIRRLAGTVRRVVLLGPAHYVGFKGIAASSASVFETPLGAIPLDTPATQQALEHPAVTVVDQAHAPEHSLEVQLPFLQEALDTFQLVPLLACHVEPQQVAEVLERLWGGPETLIVISSDLSHYLNDQTAKRIDAATSAAIEAIRPDQIAPEQACGCIPIRGLLGVASQHGLSAKTLDLRNSSDTGGGPMSRDRVVGYGAYALFGTPAGASTPLSKDDREALLKVAADSIAHGLAHRSPLQVDLSSVSNVLTQHRATFVTLNLNDKLRGCIGSLQAGRPLIQDVAYNAFAAAFKDPRFPLVNQDEASRLKIHISVLTPLEPMQYDSQEALLEQIRPGVDGLLLEEQPSSRGTLLPSVWEAVPDVNQFLAHLKLKAGLPADYWSPTVRVSRYSTESVS